LTDMARFLSPRLAQTLAQESEHCDPLIPTNRTSNIVNMGITGVGDGRNAGAIKKISHRQINRHCSFHFEHISLATRRCRLRD
jgi:hypothetical protein